MSEKVEVSIELRVGVPKLHDAYYGAVESSGLRIHKVLTRPDHNTLIVQVPTELLQGYIISFAPIGVAQLTKLLEHRAFSVRKRSEILIVVGEEYDRSDIGIHEDIISFVHGQKMELRVYCYHSDHA